MTSAVTGTPRSPSSPTTAPAAWRCRSVAVRARSSSPPSSAIGGSLSYDAARAGIGRGWNAVIDNHCKSPSTVIGGGGPAAQQQGQRVVSGRAFSTAFRSQTLAITTTWSIGNERTQTDIIFNTAFQPGASTMGIARTASSTRPRRAPHELGHLRPRPPGHRHSRPSP